MKKFEFELQDVYEFRKFERAQAESELGKALAVENEIQEKLNIIASQYINAKTALKGSLNFDDLMAFDRHTKLLEFQKNELLKQLSQAKIETEAKRKIVAECIKKTTSLEKMQEVQMQEYKEQEKKLAKKEMSNLVNMKS